MTEAMIAVVLCVAIICATNLILEYWRRMSRVAAFEQRLAQMENADRILFDGLNHANEKAHTLAVDIEALKKQATNAALARMR